MSSWMAHSTLNSLTVLDIQQALTGNYTLELVAITHMHPQNAGGRHLEDKERMKIYLVFQFEQADIRTHKHT